LSFNSYNVIIDVLFLRAVTNGNLAEVKLFAHSSPTMEIKDSQERTLLQIASQAGHLAIVKLLLKKRAQVNARDPNNWTALLLAAEFEHLQVCKLLINNGADVNIQNRAGDTFIHLLRSPNASREDRSFAKLFKMAMERGSDLNLGNAQGFTPLHKAVITNDLEKTYCLLRTNVNPNPKDK
jgi:ankyrin repeat protein